MDILLVALKFVTCFYLSMNFISCLGLEEFSLDGAIGDDLEKEVPILRDRRSIRLCPHGMSGEQCFYSQLAMFVRQHNSFTDPVALRNIGKRASSSGSAIDENDLEYYDSFFEEDYPLDISRLSDTDLPPIVFNKATPHKLPNSGDIYDAKSILGKILKMPSVLDGIDGEQIIGNAKPRADTDFTKIQPTSKRQIICPPGMPRIACYDNALAFYIQLMRTMNHKRFV